MHFNQNRETLPLSVRGGVQFFCESQIVERIHAAKKMRGATGFVALQVADQVPDRVQIGDLRLLGLPFLHAILAEMPHARFVGGQN